MIPCSLRMKYAFKYFAKSSCELVQLMIRNSCNFSSHYSFYTFINIKKITISIFNRDYIDLYVLNIKCHVHCFPYLCIVCLRHDFIWKVYEALRNSPRGSVKIALTRSALRETGGDRVREPAGPVLRRHRARALRTDPPHPLWTEDRGCRQDRRWQVDPLSDSLQNRRSFWRQDLYWRSRHLNSGTFGSSW